MQLGYTIPLQKYLGMKAPSYGRECDLRFCWDLHVLRIQGKSSLFGVHCSSRYAFLLYHLTEEEWRQAPVVAEKEIRRCMEEDGISPEKIGRYFHMAGEVEITKTHGRRPVAFLNKAVDDLYSLPITLSEETVQQPQISHFLNNIPCRAAGHPGKAAARIYFRKDMEGLLET